MSWFTNNGGELSVIDGTRLLRLIAISELQLLLRTFRLLIHLNVDFVKLGFELLFGLLALFFVVRI